MKLDDCHICEGLEQELASVNKKLEKAKKENIYLRGILKRLFTDEGVTCGEVSSCREEYEALIPESEI